MSPTNDMPKFAAMPTKLPYTLEPGIAAEAAVGLIFVASDGSIEYEWRQMFQSLPGAAFFTRSIVNDNTISRESLTKVGRHIGPAVRALRAGEPLDVIAFGCTSAAMLLGADAVTREITGVRKDVPCTMPLVAASAGLHALGKHRIALLTPYAPDIHALMHRQLENDGFEVLASGSFCNDDDAKVARIDAASMIEAAERLAGRADVDALFISCTTMRVLHLIERLENHLGKPVVTSNQALCWHALRIAGYRHPITGFGRLPSLV
ncbi:MAG: aspartate/glutamate racemase family protein [Rhodospirillales bacterium]|nr:aspartate/glutamate racemase family protein [Rhodospirillales bacterium]